MSKLQWTMLTIGGIIFVVSFNIGLAIRDYKHIQEPQIEKPKGEEFLQNSSPIYQSIPVIPFSE